MTLVDPFATAPETPADIAPQTSSVDVKDRPVAPTSEGKVVLTFKGGSGYDAPWIVVHATDLDEALSFVSADNGPKLADLMTRVQKAGSEFAGQAPPKAPNPNSGAPAANGRPAGATEAPAWAGACPPGYKYASGVKNGRTWHAWFPIERDGGEKIWLNPPK